MNSVHIMGVGMTPWGKYPDHTFVDLGVQAVRAALADAGITWAEVESVSAASHVWGGLPGIMAGNQLVAAMGGSGVPVSNGFNACASTGGALYQAYLEIAAGMADVVLAFGADKSPQGFFPQVPKVIPQPIDVDELRITAVAASNPVYWALECRRRMERVGTTEEDLALVKVLLSRNGAHNPVARFQRTYDVDEVLGSPMVADPLHLLELCATSDGAAAAVLCSERIARGRGSTGVRLAGVGIGTGDPDDPTLRMPFLATTTRAAGRALSESVNSAARAYRQAGVGPEDLDVVELPDNSSWHVLAYLEALDLCAPGEAEALVRSGDVALTGRLPICPSGGLSSLGEAVSAQGIAQLVELTRQLQGHAGARQVDGARVGLGQVYGLFGVSSTVIAVS
ncbi:MAG TPA: lipid-transfer protein [Candidatus Dormibacteraeota bacterium]